MRAKIELWRNIKDSNTQEFMSNAQQLLDISHCLHISSADYESKLLHKYIPQLTELQSDIWTVCRLKVDELTISIMENVENYLRLTEEEKVQIKDITNKSKQGGTMKKQEDFKDSRLVKEGAKNIKLGFYINYLDKQYRHAPIDFGELKMKCDIPKHMQQTMSIIMRALWTSYDDYSNHKYLMDMSVGGVMTIDLLNFPTLAKPAKKWVLRLIYPSDQTLKKISYPAPNNAATSSESISASGRLCMDSS